MSAYSRGRLLDILVFRVGAYSRGCLLDIPVSRVGAYSRGRLLEGAFHRSIRITENLQLN